jgi:hypothetical protein
VPLLLLLLLFAKGCWVVALVVDDVENHNKEEQAPEEKVVKTDTLSVYIEYIAAFVYI